mmetsp:Transcript_18250/g.52056  ORF Transcript_18250/g.52056 Transcript_18250/m.52056 type:complete len:297 (+) Transcript_18250:564-1454(+)
MHRFSTKKQSAELEVFRLEILDIENGCPSSSMKIDLSILLRMAQKRPQVGSLERRSSKLANVALLERHRNKFISGLVECGKVTVFHCDQLHPGWNNHVTVDTCWQAAKLPSQACSVHVCVPLHQCQGIVVLRGHQCSEAVIGRSIRVECHEYVQVLLKSRTDLRSGRRFVRLLGLMHRENMFQTTEDGFELACMGLRETLRKETSRAALHNSHQSTAIPVCLRFWRRRLNTCKIQCSMRLCHHIDIRQRQRHGPTAHISAARRSDLNRAFRVCCDYLAVWYSCQHTKCPSTKVMIF